MSILAVSIIVKIPLMFRGSQQNIYFTFLENVLKIYSTYYFMSIVNHFKLVFPRLKTNKLILIWFSINILNLILK